jgi:hypothetical protein
MNINSTYYNKSESRVPTPVNILTENVVPNTKIEITNSKIVNFYNSHPNINIEEVNLHFINLLINTFSHTVCDVPATTILSTINRENVDKINVQKSEFSCILSQLYPSADITCNNDLFSMKRLQKSKILLKSVHAECNISNESIGEFVDLIDSENCNGIIFSQNSGISNKNNFQIDFHNKNIIIYVHNVKYSNYLITSAVDIVDTLYTKLQNFSKNYGQEFSIPKEILDNINAEYNVFITQKRELLDMIKEYQKKLLSQVEECRFSSLNILLSEKYSVPIQKAGFNCDLCKKYSGHNLKALAAHKRGCLRKKQQI